MNLNKNFLSEVIKYLISKGVTVHDVLDAFHAEFECREQLINRQEEIRKGEDLDSLLWGKIVEERSIPCEKIEEKTETPVKPENKNKSWIDYPKNLKNHGNGVSPARKALFDIVGDKTVIEHLKANGIDYKIYDNRVRKGWSIAEACTTPLLPRGKAKTKRIIKEPETAVIIPDNVKVVEESSTKKPKAKMMLVNGRMTEMKVSDTDLVQSGNTEKPEETLETKTETLETQSNTEKATETVENVTELMGNNISTVILDTPNPDAIRKYNDDCIEKALKKFVTHSEESKKDQKPKETKSDLSVLEICQKMNVTTHELREMITVGEFPQPDCGKKWSRKILVEKGYLQ